MCHREDFWWCNKYKSYHSSSWSQLSLEILQERNLSPYFSRQTEIWFYFSNLHLKNLNLHLFKKAAFLLYKNSCHLSFQLISKYNFVDHEKSFPVFLVIILISKTNFLYSDTWLKTKVLLPVMRIESQEATRPLSANVGW